MDVNGAHLDLGKLVELASRPSAIWMDACLSVLAGLPDQVK